MPEEDATLQTVRRIEKAQADMDVDMEKDRQHLQDINIRLSSVENQLEELRKAINQNARRVKDKIQDVVDPIIESTDRLEHRIAKSKMVVLKEETKTWWQKLVKGVKI